MLRRLVLILSLAALPFTAAAQDAETLADIKAELSVLMADFTLLKQELVASGAAASGAGGGDALQRMDAIEAELMRLTAKAEEIELRLSRVVDDGTNRIGDIEFRLCEVTPGCDIATLPETPVLGGDAATAGAALPETGGDTLAGTDAGTGSDTGEGGAELAVGEQADFDRAKEVLASGDFRAAAELFATFTQSYTGGPLTQEAHYLRGEALNQAGDTANAARAYLEAFSGQPDGDFAPPALLKLGAALGLLGQVPEACVTLREVGARFPGSAEAGEAQTAMQALACP